MRAWLGPRLLAAALILLAGTASADEDLFGTGRLRIGVGDRLVLWNVKPAIRTIEAAASRGILLDYVQLWLTPGWQDSWLDPLELREVERRGAVPVVTHYWFGDRSSRERFGAERNEWYASLWRMSQRIRGERPVLVVLEPEFNVKPPSGERSVMEWDGFADHLRAAALMIRSEAPNARVGVCPGDFPGPPRLERVLGPVADDLDFLAFQEMRARTDPESGRPGYLEVGRAAVDYAAYLQRAFGRPLLLAYVAVSSHGGWVREQAEALADVARHSSELRRAGVFGAIYFQLYDDPAHEGYFGAGEKHFGLLRPDGKPKRAFSVFRSLARRGPTERGRTR